ncbi:modification methylase [Paenibacillus wenxiniae]|uniref:site-specific DNA-methyltransferase (cytosine-N(4)-specific) n=1 Tax=Paenibacillus wenxiniae TaxID=1636843 RepID=A0ABW4RQG5_9BACL
MRNIAFKEYKRKDDIHGTVLYPAVMVAPVQKVILKDIINKENMSVFDPFHGSGTSLYEAMEISSDTKLIGLDINPLANLITKVKLQGVSKVISKSISQLKKMLINTMEIPKHHFPNVEKWFREDVISSLSRIRFCIMRIKTNKDRLFFWCMFSNIVRKYSNSRSSTYKLHIKQEENIVKMNNNIINDFIILIEKNEKLFRKKAQSFNLIKGDTLALIKNFQRDEFDICITSPPYGDNSTTVPYGQFSMLALHWIDSKDLELEGWEMTNYSIIDSKSLGGTASDLKEYQENDNLVSPYIENISLKKQVKVKRFFNDYFIFLNEISRVTNSYIVMTLGNRTVDGIKINLTDITLKYLKNKNFHLEEEMEREIISKRIPKRVSRVKNKSVSSMNREYVIVLKKIK